MSTPKWFRRHIWLNKTSGNLCCGQRLCGQRRGAMVLGISISDLTVIPATDSPCPRMPCPFCRLGLPHDATQEMVMSSCVRRTCDVTLEFRGIAAGYVEGCVAARNILHGLGSTARLPIATTLYAALGEATVADFAETMTVVADPRKHVPGPPADDLHHVATSGWAAPLSSTASGSEGTTRGHKRWMETDEFPQWQYQGGKKMKWTAYDRDSNGKLENAYTTGESMVTLSIEDWEYIVDLGAMSQWSGEAHRTRLVRRLTGPPDV